MREAVGTAPDSIGEVAGRMGEVVTTSESPEPFPPWRARIIA
jgi:hypothetical protein